MDKLPREVPEVFNVLAKKVGLEKTALKKWIWRKITIDLDTYKAAIQNAFDDVYVFEFVVDASNHPHTAWKEHGGISVISGFTSNTEFSDIRNKLLEIYRSLSDESIHVH